MSAFESKIEKLSADSQAKYRRALSALEVFLLAHDMTISDLTPRVAEDWIYDMMRLGKPRSTIVRNLNILSSVLRGETDSDKKETAERCRELARKFERTTPVIPPLAIEKNINNCLTVVRSWIKDTAAQSPIQDLVLVSLLNGCIPVRQLAEMRKASITDYTGRSRVILDRNISATRDYVFDLRQSHSTPRQLIKKITEEIFSRFPRIFDSKDYDTDQLINSIWVAMAIRCGATASEALGCVDGAAYAATDFITPVPRQPEAKIRWIKTVSTMLSRETLHWYAMHLRQGVTFDEIQKEIATGIRPVPTLFYPCRQISKNIRNKKVIAEQPFIASTVFFKTNPDAVLPLFRKIGDKAWCYRMTNTPGSPYAIIPTSEMARFQSAIGQFTPDTEIHPIGEIPLQPDDRVILLMADFYHQEATVDKIITNSEGRTIYRVTFTNSSGFEWTLDADTRQLLPST